MWGNGGDGGDGGGVGDGRSGVVIMVTLKTLVVIMVVMLIEVGFWRWAHKDAHIQISGRCGYVTFYGNSYS